MEETVGNLWSSLSGPLLWTSLLMSGTGIIVAFVKGLPVQLYNIIKNRKYIFLRIEESDDAYDWLQCWLIKNHPKVKALDSVTQKYKQKDTYDISTLDSRPIPAVLPSKGIRVRLKFDNVKLIINKNAEVPGAKTDRQADTKIIKSFTVMFKTKDEKIIMKFLHAIRDTAIPIDSKVSVFIARVNSVYSYWRMANREQSRPIESVILDGDLTESIIKDVITFKNSRKWYESIGIPYRRGYLFYGEPGNGKSSLIHALASHFKMNVYVLNLAEKGVTDSVVRELFADIDDNSIILLEDIDAVFNGRTVIKAAIDSDDTHAPKDALTFSGILNTIDGLGGRPGRIIMATTNYKDKLDSALIRPGRVDVSIKIENASRDQAKRLFKHFYHNNVDEKLADDFVLTIPPKKFSMASLQGYLIEYKDDPKGAVESIEEFINSQQLEKDTNSNSIPLNPSLAA